MDGLSDIGGRNAEFARRFLAAENIPCVAESLGGESGRRLKFWPASGRARQALLANTRPQPAPPPRIRTEIELF